MFKINAEKTSKLKIIVINKWGLHETNDYQWIKLTFLKKYIKKSKYLYNLFYQNISLIGFLVHLPFFYFFYFVYLLLYPIFNP